MKKQLYPERNRQQQLLCLRTPTPKHSIKIVFELEFEYKELLSCIFFESKLYVGTWIKRAYKLFSI